jgi:hypothetical protein
MFRRMARRFFGLWAAAADSPGKTSLHGAGTENPKLTLMRTNKTTNLRKMNMTILVVDDAVSASPCRRLNRELKLIGSRNAND